MSLVPWDAGLQNERTGLAWQRTLLSGLTVSLLVARLLATFSVALAVAVGAAALISTAILGVFSIRRYLANHYALYGGRVVEDGRTALVVTGLVLLTALGGLAYVLIV